MVHFLIDLAFGPKFDTRQFLPVDSHVYLAAYVLNETGKLLTFHGDFFLGLVIVY